jgi:hypothetical protein
MHVVLNIVPDSASFFNSILYIVVVRHPQSLLIGLFNKLKIMSLFSYEAKHDVA